MTEKVKIRFKLNPEDEQGYEVENLWAEPLEDHNFRILNSPFFVFDVSFDDIVKAVAHDSGLQYAGIARRGGHSTYRIFLPSERTIEDSSFQEHWKPISHQGATMENANDRFIAVDVPPDADISAIYHLLQEGENAAVWSFEEGHYFRQST
jgi:Domain of unknown function (DUF4265)